MSDSSFEERSENEITPPHDYEAKDRKVFLVCCYPWAVDYNKPSGGGDIHDSLDSQMEWSGVYA